MSNNIEDLNYCKAQLEELQEKLGYKEVELHEKSMENDRIKLENAQLRSDLRKYQDVLSELGSGVKKVSSDIPILKNKVQNIISTHPTFKKLISLGLVLVVYAR